MTYEFILVIVKILFAVLVCVAIIYVTILLRIKKVNEDLKQDNKEMLYFPLDPEVGDIVTIKDQCWLYDGENWDKVYPALE